MENKDTGLQTKLFIALGIITIISGVILAFEKPLIGIPGSIIGVWLVVANLNKMKAKKIK